MNETPETSSHSHLQEYLPAADPERLKKFQELILQALQDHGNHPRERDDLFYAYKHTERITFPSPEHKNNLFKDGHDNQIRYFATAGMTEHELYKRLKVVTASGTLTESVAVPLNLICAKPSKAGTVTYYWRLFSAKIRTLLGQEEM